MAFLSLSSELSIYYELVGHGKPIVLIAGHRGDHSSWNLIAPELAAYFQVLTFDNLAAGQTRDNNEPLSIESMADATWSLITQLNLKHPIIVGESMGGAIAQVIAHKHGKELHQLVIINSMMKINQATLMAYENQLHCRQANIPFDLLFSGRLPWIFSSDFLSNPENIENFRMRLLNNPHPPSIENQARQFQACKHFDSRLWVGNIQVPTLVISAQNDRVFLPSEAQALAQTIPHAKFVSISGGHGSPFEVPIELTTVIKDFILQVE